MVFPNHTQNSSHNFMCMHVTSTITILSKHTHDITISALNLSTNPTYYKKFDNYCNPKCKKLDYSLVGFYRKV
jgi:hypothetical protein